MNSIFWIGFVFERTCGFSAWTSLRFENFVHAWLLRYAYVLVHVLDVVIVLFQSGVFELVYSSGWGGPVVHICKTCLCTPRKLPWGAENEGAYSSGNTLHFVSFPIPFFVMLALLSPSQCSTYIYARLGRVDRNWTKSGGRPSLMARGFVSG